jgi:hypothetical protein
MKIIFAAKSGLHVGIVYFFQHEMWGGTLRNRPDNYALVQSLYSYGGQLAN